MSKYEYNKDYFEKIDSEDKAYWLGFLYADGCICRQYRNEKLKAMNIELSLCGEDKLHLEKFANSLQTNVPIKKKITKCNGKEYESYRITINNTKMCRDLIDLGCTPQKTYDIKFPTYDIVPEQYIRDFLRGFFDGDGCICTTMMNGKPHIVINISGMSDMLQSISDFLLSKNIIRKPASIHQDKRRQLTYELFIYGTDTVKEVLDYLYKDSKIYLDRKYQKYIDFYKDYTPIEKRGVHWHKENKAYVVTICINGEHIRVGQYKNLDDAIEARKEAEKLKYSQEKPA